VGLGDHAYQLQMLTSTAAELPPAPQPSTRKARRTSGSASSRCAYASHSTPFLRAVFLIASLAKYFITSHSGGVLIIRLTSCDASFSPVCMYTVRGWEGCKGASRVAEDKLLWWTATAHLVHDDSTRATLHTTPSSKLAHWTSACSHAPVQSGCFLSTNPAELLACARKTRGQGSAARCTAARCGQRAPWPKLVVEACMFSYCDGQALQPRGREVRCRDLCCACNRLDGGRYIRSGW